METSHFTLAASGKVEKQLAWKYEEAYILQGCNSGCHVCKSLFLRGFFGLYGNGGGCRALDFHRSCDILVVRWTLAMTECD